jgi:membrane protein CcdC involved in cytochrome C biogenesis
MVVVMVVVVVVVLKEVVGEAPDMDEQAGIFFFLCFAGLQTGYNETVSSIDRHSGGES